MAKGRTHVTASERAQIEVLLKRGDSQRSIARLLERPASTIRREIGRNGGERGYDSGRAQSKAERRRSIASRRRKKMTAGKIAAIEEKLTQSQWSPEQIGGWMKATGAGAISHERIYQHVWADKRTAGGLYKHLRHAGKKYNKRKGKTSGRGLIPNRVDIDRRPAVVADKTRIGDWEIDTVIGAARRGVLVTAVDRASKYTVIQMVANKTAALVGAALVRRLGTLDHKVLTITADNGKEFAGHEKIAAALNASVYFAKPYHSWERGLNEHTNGLIRQYLPKGLSFAGLTDARVDHIECLLNNRPRKSLGFKTPSEVFATPPPGAIHC